MANDPNESGVITIALVAGLACLVVFFAVLRVFGVL
jgi:hypothetical protein